MVVPQAEIDKGYNGLLNSTEEFLNELKSRQEQQRIEEEEADKMRKIKEEQVSLLKLNIPWITAYLIVIIVPESICTATNSHAHCDLQYLTAMLH